MARKADSDSALMVMQHKYGRDNMHRFLRHELDQYLRGRGTEVRHEPALALVQREPYVWYQKGGPIMYTLADHVGEEKVNLALRNFRIDVTVWAVCSVVKGGSVEFRVGRWR